MARLRRAAEYSKMIAAQKSRTAASYLSKRAEAQIENHRN